MKTPRRRPILTGIIATSALAAVAGPALAQSLSANSASYNAGWGRSAGQENRGVDPNTRDANGNRVVIDGMIMTGSNQGFFASGAASAFAGVGAGAGAGAGGATAIGNNLTVITQGDNNVVVVDSRQINNGTVTAAQNESVSGNGQ
jgi:holdfast attachment protein HfaA